MAVCVWGGLILHPSTVRPHRCLCVVGRCWALNENMAYWWIIRIPILLASMVGDPGDGAGSRGSPWLGLGWREGWLCSMGAPHCPPQINLLIFMRILKVILAKLRANQKGYADYKLR